MVDEDYNDMDMGYEDEPEVPKVEEDGEEEENVQNEDESDPVEEKEDEGPPKERAISKVAGSGQISKEKVAAGVSFPPPETLVAKNGGSVPVLKETEDFPPLMKAVRGAAGSSEAGPDPAGTMASKVLPIPKDMIDEENAAFDASFGVEDTDGDGMCYFSDESYDDYTAGQALGSLMDDICCVPPMVEGEAPFEKVVSKIQKKKDRLHGDW